MPAKKKRQPKYKGPKSQNLANGQNYPVQTNNPPAANTFSFDGGVH